MVVPWEKKELLQQFHFPGIYPLKLETTVLRYLYTHVHGSIIHNSQNMDTNPVFINQLMDYQNVVCSYNRILFGLKKRKGNSEICHKMDDLEDIMLSKINQS